MLVFPDRNAEGRIVPVATPSLQESLTRPGDNSARSGSLRRGLSGKEGGAGVVPGI